ncbi:MAG: AraC family transcriptional regulator [Verrucomicrobia bacterium]|nr:MAG: AraC family transcriptional regulator [Verrucomicrobiota bacterium]
MIPKTVGLIVFEQMIAADLMGPAETFSRSVISSDHGGNRRCYQVVTIGVDTEDCVAESGIIVRPQVDTQHAPQLDTLILPGGNGLHDARLSKKVERWLSSRVHATRRVATLGSGIYPLAAAGLLDGRNVTTHWRLTKDVAMRFPKLRLTPNSLFVKDDRFYTCAGGASAVDLALALIEEDYGPRLALTIARELVLYFKRPGYQDQQSEALQFQSKSVSRLSELPTWITSHLNENLSVEVLATKACLCRRHFTRRFKMEFGTSPADFVERLRLDEACRRLSIRDSSIESVGESIGFKSADAFRRAFERRLGVNPSNYRRHVESNVKCVRNAAHRRHKLAGFSKAA